MVCIFTFLAHLIGIHQKHIILHIVKTSQVTIWSRIQKYYPQNKDFKIQHKGALAGLKYDQNLSGYHLQMTKRDRHAPTILQKYPKNETWL